VIKRRRLKLLIGITIVLVLSVLLIFGYKSTLLKAKETVLRDNLVTMRRVIKQHIKDKQQPPHSLQDLVDAGYFRQLPIDPVTNSNSTWKPVVETMVVSPGHTDRGITDVHSGSVSISSIGTTYDAW
jgi:general secretion pathway protein G